MTTSLTQPTRPIYFPFFSFSELLSGLAEQQNSVSDMFSFHFIYKYHIIIIIIHLYLVIITEDRIAVCHLKFSAPFSVALQSPSSTTTSTLPQISN